MDETEDEIIKRIARDMFGGAIILHPETLEIAKALYRKYLDDMKENAA